MKILLQAVPFVLVLSVTLAAEPPKPTFLQEPESRSQFLGRDVVFQCSLEVVDIIPWNIKTEPALTGSKPELGLWYRVAEINETAKVSNLTVPANSYFDKEELFCTGIYYDGVYGWVGGDRSKVAILLVQGVPDVITQFNGDNTSSSMILFEWTPPTHHPGLPPCCDSYYVNVTHFSSSESLVDDNVTTPSIEFPIPEDRLCDVLLVSIIATNVVGDGAEFEQRWSLGGHFETRTANTSLMYNRTGSLILDIRIEIRGYCLSDLNNVTFSLRCDDTPNDLVTTRLITALPNERVHSTELNLTITESHTERRCLWDVALDNDVDYNGFLSTYDVTNATVNDTGPGYICIACSFIPLTRASGCYVNLTRVTSIFDTAMVLKSANLPMSGGGGCVNVSLGGDYLVTVHDWNQDDDDYSINPAFNLSTVFIPPPPPLILSSSVPSPSPTETVEPTANNDAVIAVSSAFGGAILLIIVPAIVTLVIVLMIYKKKKNKKYENRLRSPLEPVVADGPTLNYVNPCNLRTVGGNKEELVDAAKRQMEQFYDDIVSREGNRPFRFKVGHKRSEEDEFVLIVTKEYNE